MLPYDTSGFWDWEGNSLAVAITPQRNLDYAFLLAIHEIVEGYLCRKAGIPDDLVTEFDMAFERRRKRGDESEPGDHPKAPYRNEHKAAERIERLLAKELGVDFNRYLKNLI